MISIVGAGPSGSYLAYLLAQYGEDVHVFEEHREIGNPIQCTGLVTHAITRLIDVKKEFLVNTISRIKVIAPNGEQVEFSLKRPDFVFHRARFDQHIARMAQEAGAVFHLSKKFVGFHKNTVTFGDGSMFTTDSLVGADGPLSPVAKSAGMFHQRSFMTGLQARAQGSFDADCFVVYLGKGYFGWSVPENSRFSRIGVIVTGDHPQSYFDSVLRRERARIIEYQSGLIPVYQSGISCQKENVFLLGDAATQCKASTHGGIIQGMFAAIALKDALLHRRNYDRLWRKKLGRDLYVHLKIREKLDGMTDERLNYLVKLVQKEKIKNVLETYERDYAFKIIAKILLKEPRFLRFLI